MAVADVGARLVLRTATETIAKIKKATTAFDALAGAMDKAADSAKASGVEISASVDKVAASTAEASKGIRSLTSASVAQVAATRKLSDGVTEHAKSQVGFNKAIASVAESPIGKYSRYGALGVAGGLYESVKMYTNFNKQMTQLSTQAGVNINRIPGLSSGAVNIAKQTGVAFSTIANQMYRIASAKSGLHATNQEILGLSKSAANVAVLLNTSPGAPTENVARLFGSLTTASTKGKNGNSLRGVGGAKHIASLLNAAVGTGDIRGTTLVGSLSSGILQSGQAVGATVKTLLGWIDLQTRLGAKPSTAGTLISHSLQQIAAPSEQGQKAEMMFGIQQGTLYTMIKTQGVGAAVTYIKSSIVGGLNTPTNYPQLSGASGPGRASALKQLQDWGINPTLFGKLSSGTSITTKTVQDQLLQFMFTKIFGGARQELPFLSVAENGTMYASILKQLTKQDNSKTYNKDLTHAMSTPAQQMKIALRNIQSYGMVIGKDVTPALLDILKGVETFVETLSKNKAALVAVLGALGTFMAVGLSATVYTKIAKSVSAVGKLVKFFAGMGGTGKTLSAEGIAAQNQTAAGIQLDAARMQLAAAGGNDAAGAEGAAAAGAAGAAGGAAKWAVNSAGEVIPVAEGSVIAAGGNAIGPLSDLGLGGGEGLGLSELAGTVIGPAIIAGIATYVGVHLAPGLINKATRGYDPNRGPNITTLLKVYPPSVVAHMATVGKIKTPTVAAQAKALATGGTTKQPPGFHATYTYDGKLYHNVIIGKHGNLYQRNTSTQATTSLGTYVHTARGGYYTNVASKVPGNKQYIGNVNSEGPVYNPTLTKHHLIHQLKNTPLFTMINGTPVGKGFPKEYTPQNLADVSSQKTLESFGKHVTKIVKAGGSKTTQSLKIGADAQKDAAKLQQEAANQAKKAATSTGKAAEQHEKAAKALTASATALLQAANAIVNNSGATVGVVNTALAQARAAMARK